MRKAPSPESATACSRAHRVRSRCHRTGRDVHPRPEESDPRPPLATGPAAAPARPPPAPRTTPEPPPQTAECHTPRPAGFGQTVSSDTPARPRSRPEPAPHPRQIPRPTPRMNSPPAEAAPTGSNPEEIRHGNRRHFRRAVNSREHPGEDRTAPDPRTPGPPAAGPATTRRHRNRSTPQSPDGRTGPGAPARIGLPERDPGARNGVRSRDRTGSRRGPDGPGRLRHTRRVTQPLARRQPGAAETRGTGQQPPSSRATGHRQAPGGRAAGRAKAGTAARRAGRASGRAGERAEDRPGRAGSMGRRVDDPAPTPRPVVHPGPSAQASPLRRVDHPQPGTGPALPEAARTPQNEPPTPTGPNSGAACGDPSVPSRCDSDGSDGPSVRRPPLRAATSRTGPHRSARPLLRPGLPPGRPASAPPGRAGTATAVELYRSDPALTYAQVGRDLGVHPESLRQWVRAAGTAPGPDGRVPAGPAAADRSAPKVQTLRARAPLSVENKEPIASAQLRPGLNP